jgi:hypothetical protein
MPNAPVASGQKRICFAPAQSRGRHLADGFFILFQCFLLQINIGCHL